MVTTTKLTTSHTHTRVHVHLWIVHSIISGPGTRSRLGSLGVVCKHMAVMATCKTSCETHRTQAYSEDLRWRIIYQYYSLHKTYQQIAESLNVDKSTVSRIVVLFNETGTVSKRQYPDSHSASHRKLTEVDKLMIIEIALDKPGIYLGEIKQCLLEEHGTDVSVSTICKYLHNEDKK